MNLFRKMEGYREMKKATYNLLIILALVSLAGCESKAKKEELADYIVVEVPDNTSIDDLFEFDSISQIIVSDIRESLGKGSCYCIGALPEGDSVVWESGSHLFLYVKDKVSEIQVMLYANKIEKPGISYDRFKEQNK